MASIGHSSQTRWYIFGLATIERENIDLHSFVGIIPVDGIWTDEANAYFRKLTLNVRLEAKFIKSHVSDQNGVTYPIEVALIEGPIRSRIGDIMIEQRLAKKA